MAWFLAASILAIDGSLIGAFVINATLYPHIAPRRITPKQ
jgi:hypothetical protein